MNNKRKPTIVEKNNIKILIDPTAEMYLFGTTIDHISEDYEKGLFENKFIFLPDKKIAGQRFPALLGSSRKINPKFFALTREKQKQIPPKHKKTPKNTQKIPPKIFFTLTREKKGPKKNFRAYARKNNHLPGKI